MEKAEATGPAGAIFFHLGPGPFAAAAGTGPTKKAVEALAPMNINEGDKCHEGEAVGRPESTHQTKTEKSAGTRDEIHEESDEWGSMATIAFFGAS